MRRCNIFIFLFIFIGLLAHRPSYAFIESCYEEVCAIPQSSAQFFMDDVNELPDIDDLSPLLASGQFWPVEGLLTGHFGKWRGGRRSGHIHVGVDIASRYGTKIHAPLKGIVAFVGRKGGYGLTLIIDHGEGIATLYAHNSDVLVSEGDGVKKGQVISKLGSSGRSSGPHLHYEVRIEGMPVNPLAWTEKLQSQNF